MRIFFLILVIWLLINVFFVIATTPPLKASRQKEILSADAASAARERISERHPFEPEETTSLMSILMSIGIGIFFVLALPLAEILDRLRKSENAHEMADTPPVDNNGQNSLGRELRAPTEL